MDINFLDLKKQYETIDIDKLTDKIKQIISGGQFVGGSYLETFEKNFAKYNGTKHAVGVGSGTDALIFSLLGLGIGKGDEVLVPANTFIATAFAVSHVGATPVFVDVNPSTYLMDKSIEKYITDNTKVIIPVHLYGNAVYMPDIMDLADKYKLLVIEDCAQAIGAEIEGVKVGKWGNAGAFSFYPAKNLGGLGQGGAVVTDNKKIANKVRSLGNVGRKEGSWFEYDVVGYNSRLDTINALFLNTCLEHIDDWNAKRKSVAEIYSKELAIVEGISLPKNNTDHVYHLYEIKLNDKETRDDLKEYLMTQNIFSGLHYPLSCHKQEIYSGSSVNLKVSEDLSDTLLSIPMHPFLTEDEIKQVCFVIKKFLEG
ncbi:MAG: DegT/DnrJ/EryC1/StrS family aminotransferase [Campylobacterota bacterium]|nr:DegT/DnrJ/EryC1/StrS family aminotransferase [Campylobacterota bacterium]